MSAGVAASKLPRPRGSRQSREWQAEQVKTTGFVQHSDVGHAVVDALQRKGYSPTVALYAGHLAAVGSKYNWQGNTRISDLMHRSARTVQRARAVLEADRLITSHLLLTGDLVEGQRAPVRHPQVVRDVTRLQRLAGMRGAPMRQPRARRPSAADVPRDISSRASRIDIDGRATAAELAELARARPEFAAFFSGLAASAAKHVPAKPPPGCPAALDPQAIDEWDRSTLEREQARQRERDPPDRRPPRNE